MLPEAKLIASSIITATENTSDLNLPINLEIQTN